MTPNGPLLGLMGSLKLAFPRQAGGKGHREHSQRALNLPFLDRQREKAIARDPNAACLSMKSVFSASHGPRVPRDRAKPVAITRIIRFRKLTEF